MKYGSLGTTGMAASTAVGGTDATMLTFVSIAANVVDVEEVLASSTFGDVAEYGLRHHTANVECSKEHRRFKSCRLR